MEQGTGGRVAAAESTRHARPPLRWLVLALAFVRSRKNGMLGLKNIMASGRPFAILRKPSHRSPPVSNCVRLPSTRGKFVRDDWRAWLPQAKAQVFDTQVHRLESSYVMLSVSLDEAIALRHRGFPSKSLHAGGITSDLSKLLNHTLAGLLRALSEHA